MSTGSISSAARTALVFVAGAAFALIAWRLATIWAAPFHCAIRGWDDTGYYLWLRSAVNDGDLNFKNDLEETRTLNDEERAIWLRLPLTQTGLIPNKYGVGWSISSAPFYLVGKLALKGAAMVGWPVSDSDPDHALCQVLVILGQAFYAFAGLWLVWRMLKRWFSAEKSLWAVLLIWLNSPLVYYMTYKLTLSHSVTFFWVAFSWFAAFRVKDDEQRQVWWGLTGLAVGMSVICRFQAILFALFPLVVALSSLIRQKKAIGLHPLWLALGFFIPVSIQLVAWKIVFGQFLTYSYAGEFFQWGSPHLWDVLFSSYHGLFYWHPVLLVGLVGFVMFLLNPTAQSAPRTWLISILLAWYLNAAWSHWWFGHSFGHRAFEAALIPIMAGFAYVLSRLAVRWQRIVIPVLLIFGALNLQLAFLATTKAIPSTRPVTWPELVRHLLDFYGLS